MISDAIISFIKLILSLLPDFQVEVFEFGSTPLTLFVAAGYFLPMNTILSLFRIGLGVTMLRIVLAIILRIKSFIPGWGGN